MTARIAIAAVALESLESRRMPSATLVRGVLTVGGTNNNDVISVNSAIQAGLLSVNVNGVIQTFNKTLVKQIDVFGSRGNDKLTIGLGATGAHLYGQDGNDTVNGGAGNDSLDGGVGGVVVDGGLGFDTATADNTDTRTSIELLF